MKDNSQKSGHEAVKTVRSRTVRLTESALMIAAATVLSFVKLAELPAGGSITLASMLPLVLVAYRYGTAWGLLCGTVHGAIQFILGASVLSYVTGWQSVAAVIILDYILAFALIGLAGVFRRAIKSQSGAIIAGSVLISVLRYACHVVSGATVWAGLSIPTADALMYSFIYNATYMLPEMLILCVVGYYLSSALNFSGEKLSAAHRVNAPVSRVLRAIAGAVLAAACVFDVAAVFGVLQNEDGVFDITGISAAPWCVICIVSAAAVAAAVVLFVISRKKKN